MVVKANKKSPELGGLHRTLLQLMYDVGMKSLWRVRASVGI